mmetsp:Transcript_52507/g.166988  ORF Transcript_52507/g.166988 Transcript_52507/m.166988 type:complete len:269 (+) Transcript_52507:82-888(+)|eukprot:CAMPEP_0182859212 /NCGR_PEP_ID=MMETSP0034_2-20130328/4158_1 /TAXON_ID=156128 /ORGANISM="Nephroselmis pyriformis, Strain CCMP717" /LENGTH=268 /DNA_ID=CAMNT_0024990777 /DNA_START=76 /DNA_END=882 /DNA_ORIENTATION=-
MTTSIPNVHPSHGGSEWKIPGYTGHIPCVHETFAKTPFYGQLEALDKEDTMITGNFARPRSAMETATAPEWGRAFKATPANRQYEGNLFPDVNGGRQTPYDTSKRSSPICLGDDRISVLKTTYQDFAQSSYMKNPSTLAAFIPEGRFAFKGPEKIAQEYSKALVETGDNVFEMLMGSFRMRVEAKLKSGTNNAFMLRRLVTGFDVHKTGELEMEDFHKMLQSFGMQLSYKEVVGVMARYDPQCSGHIRYGAFMQDLLDSDYYALFNVK